MDEDCKGNPKQFTKEVLASRDVGEMTSITRDPFSVAISSPIKEEKVIKRKVTILMI